MSNQIIRRALEKRLAAMSPALATAYENVEFTPTVGTPYQSVNLLPAQPEDAVHGSSIYFERGVFQITLRYPIGTGPAAAEARAQLVRQQFKRGTSMTESGITVLVVGTPVVAPPMSVDDRYCIPISVRFQAQISS